jgi:hypothetical protein
LPLGHVSNRGRGHEGQKRPSGAPPGWGAALRLAVEAVHRISVHFRKEMKVFSDHRKLTRGEIEATDR